MEPVLIILVILVVVNAFVVWKLLQPKEQKPENTEGLILLQKQIQEMSRTMDNRLSQTADKMYDSLKDQSSQSQRLIQDINKQVNEQLRDVVARTTEVGESSKQVFAVADQLKELQNILKNPKQRGILGEYYLETVLQNVLPPDSFQMQYAFNDGEIVDAVVFVKGKVIPIDSKFSLDNYNRFAEAADGADKVQFEKVFVNDLKNRITETAKYIRPSEKTTDFAFMFIPHEGIYYDLLSNKVGAGEDNLIQRAAGKYKVIIVSPTSFLAYLQTVLQGLKAMEIEEKAQDIIKNVEKLTGHISKYEDYYNKLGKTLETTVNHYNNGYKELGKIDKDIMRITGDSAEVEVLSLEKPKQFDE
ncbi:MAG: DNA recombination protein RmuC [Candidatus Pacebacteria bacterium]|nr:DNA recombination protein RmuC [Candidatus Paceibacterota bacterium]MBP9842793.1 DNA recombination protein RmuC [Candidatus Paceibacterota bacterium]